MKTVSRVRAAKRTLVLAISLGAIALAQRTAQGQRTTSFSSSSSLRHPASYVPLAGNAAAPSSRASRVTVPPRAAQQVDLYGAPVRPFSKLAVSLEFGTLGMGLQVATPLTRTIHLRAGADFLNFSSNFLVDAAHYESQAHLRSGHLSVDWHPLGGGLRISPELLLFRSAFSSSVFVPGGQAFELGNTPYISGASDPVHGRASLSMNRTIMPALTLGFGNLLGERHRHWSIPFEIGAAYTGHYTVHLNLSGTVCTYTIGCMNTSSDQVQTSIRQEESDIDETMKHFQVYPIVSSGFAYRF